MVLCMGCMEKYHEKRDRCPYCNYRKNTPAALAYHMQPGTILEQRYMVGKVLGCGELGVTYIGMDTLLEKKVAVKEYLPDEFAARTPGTLALGSFPEEKEEKLQQGVNRFVEEARHLARFQKQGHIVQIYDIFRANHTAYIVMDFIPELQREYVRQPAVKKRRVDDGRWTFPMKLTIGLLGLCVAGLTILLCTGGIGKAEVLSGNNAMPYQTVPDLTGMDYGDAEVLLGDMGVRLRQTVSVYSEGMEENVILTQSIPEGTRVDDVLTIQVAVSSRKVPQAVIPDVFGNTEEEALSILEAHNLIVNIVYEESALAEKGMAIRTNPKAGIGAAEGTVVELVVSSGQGTASRTEQKNVQPTGQNTAGQKKTDNDSVRVVTGENEYDVFDVGE